LSVESVCPITALPKTVGVPVATGPSGRTVAVIGEKAELEPPAFAAVTLTRRVAPMSATRTT